MRLEALETRIDEFDERNLVLQVALGLASAAATVDRVLERHVPSEPDEQPGELSPEDLLLVEFALGVVSLRRTLGRILDSAAIAGAGRTVGPEAMDRDWIAGGVLR